MRRLVTLLWIVAIVGTAACSPNPAGPELTDPREILSRTIQSTAGLRSMRVRVDLETREQARPGVPQGGFAEGVLDVGAGEMSLAGAAIDGTGAFAYIQADGAAFARTTVNGRWTKVPAVGGMAGIFLLGGGAAGPQVDVPAALADLLDDPETVVELRGVEDCSTGRCYRTVVGLPPGQVWKLVVGLTGIDKLPGGAAQPQPAGIPPISFEILTDTATLRLVDLVATGTANGSSVAVRLRVAAPNEPVAIEPPPPALVDEPGANMGGGGVVAPVAPVVEPVPVESPAP